ncbi:MAG TPA: hypothetical protein PKD35_12155 [Nitrosomonas sp.]|nr:hypothetical protein [Nitrosomonas sp.]
MDAGKLSFNVFSGESAAMVLFNKPEVLPHEARVAAASKKHTM